MRYWREEGIAHRAKLGQSPFSLVNLLDPFLSLVVSMLDDSLERLQPRVDLDDAWTNS